VRSHLRDVPGVSPGPEPRCSSTVDGKYLGHQQSSWGRGCSSRSCASPQSRARPCPTHEDLRSRQGLAARNVPRSACGDGQPGRRRWDGSGAARLRQRGQGQGQTPGDPRSPRRRLGGTGRFIPSHPRLRRGSWQPSCAGQHTHRVGWVVFFFLNIIIQVQEPPSLIPTR